MLHKISTPILIAVLLYHGWHYYKERQLQNSITNYQRVKETKYPIKTPMEGAQRVAQFIKVNDEMYVATGYALGNSIILIGPTGVVVIDTTESVAGAREIGMEIRKITDKPIKGIIYTHNHPDHVLGTKEFLALNGNQSKEEVQIWAHHTLPDLFFQLTRMLGKTSYYRGMHQFGVFLNAKEFTTAGIGAKLKLDQMDTRFILPNRLLYKSKQSVSIAGIDLELMHVPGETDDQICAYWPKHEALLGTDNLYKAFPNLYAIRGTTFRSLKQWYESLDKMRALKPRYFLLSHHRPLIGKENIYRIVTNYRDGIQFVHDQTVRFMNQNMHPDDIAARLKLPESLLMEPYLSELYGTVSWSSKSLYTGYMGWFTGDISELDPMTPIERSQNLVKLAGGLEILLQNAKSALSKGDVKWALYLSSSAERAYPSNIKAKEIKAMACLDLAGRQTSRNGFNYYTTAAHITTGAVEIELPKDKRNAAIQGATVKQLFYLQSLRLKPESCPGLNRIILFIFPDVKQEMKFQIRNGVMDTGGFYERDEADIKITVHLTTWKDIITGKKNGLLSAVTSEITVEPGISSLKDLMFCFETT